MNKEQEQNLQYNILKSIYNCEFETLKKFGNPTFNQKEDFTYISIEISSNNKLDIYYNKNNKIVFQSKSQFGKNFSLPYEIVKEFGNNNYESSLFNSNFSTYKELDKTKSVIEELNTFEKIVYPFIKSIK